MTLFGIAQKAFQSIVLGTIERIALTVFGKELELENDIESYQDWMMTSSTTTSTATTKSSSSSSSASASLQQQQNQPSTTKLVFNYQKKAKQIQDCLNEHPNVDLWKLRELALSKGGLLEAKYRKQAWMYLVGMNKLEIQTLLDQEEDDDDEIISKFSPPYPSPVSVLSTPTLQQQEEEKKMEGGPDIDLIRREVGRSVVFRYNTTSTFSTTDQQQRYSTSETSSSSSVIPDYATDRLAMVLEDTIRNGGTSLHYYQGLHDVAGVLLHTMEYQSKPTIAILSKLCQSHFRDAMRENFGNVTWLLSVLLLPLVEKVDTKVYTALQMAEIDLSNICLPWVITWFTHDIYHAETAGRLIDMFLSSHPLLPFYFCVAVITHPLLQQCIVPPSNNNVAVAEEYEDPAFIFSLIKKMPLSIVSDMSLSSGATNANTTTSTIPEEEQYEQEQEQQQYIDPSWILSNAKVPVQELLEDAMSIMKRIPPRDLLQLVDKEEELYSREDLLQRASSISMFKAVPSWSTTTTTSTIFTTAILHDNNNENDENDNDNDNDNDDGDTDTNNPFKLRLPLLFSSSSLTAALATSAIASRNNNNKNKNDDNDDFVIIHAKLASGVPILADTVSASTLLRNRNWGSRRYHYQNNNNNNSSSSKKKQSRKGKKLFSPVLIKRIKRRLFGNTTSTTNGRRKTTTATQQ